MRTPSAVVDLNVAGASSNDQHDHRSRSDRRRHEKLFLQNEPKKSPQFLKKIGFANFLGTSSSASQSLPDE